MIDSHVHPSDYIKVTSIHVFEFYHKGLTADSPQANKKIKIDLTLYGKTQHMC